MKVSTTKEYWREQASSLIYTSKEIKKKKKPINIALYMGEWYRDNVEEESFADHFDFQIKWQT